MNNGPLKKIKENFDKLTKKQKDIGDFILKNYSDVSFLTIKKLSKEVNTSTTTIVRFVEMIGYSGYTDFQNDLRDFIRNDYAPNTRLTKSQSLRMKLNHNDFNDFIKYHENQMNNLIQDSNFDTINRVLSLIDKSEKIYCACARSGLPVGHYLINGINRSLGKARLIDMEYWVDEISSLNSDDLVFIISFPRYLKNVVDFAKNVKENSKSNIILITDNYSSPASFIADEIIICNTESLGFHNNPINGMIIADYLITETTYRNIKTTKKRLSKINEIMQKSDYHNK